MLSRRGFLLGAAAAPAILRGAELTPKERVNRILAGQDADRTPISLWHHFGLEKDGPAKHAEATLAFHRAYGTDVVKVMSDFPYPKPADGSAWFEGRELASPFAPQLEALERIAKGLDGKAHFVETLFNPWNVAEKMSSKEQVIALMNEQPQRLLNALEAIARSEANHARQAIQRGASGIFLAIANAQEGVMTMKQYRKFSEPFDRMVLAAVKSAPLNVLHLHGDKVWVEHFVKGWPAAAINYSIHGTGKSLRQTRARFKGVLMGGVDERNYSTATVDSLKQAVAAAKGEAGKRYIATPGCSVPDNSRPEELERMKAAVAG